MLISNYIGFVLTHPHCKFQMRVFGKSAWASPAPCFPPQQPGCARPTHRHGQGGPRAAALGCRFLNTPHPTHGSGACCFPLCPRDLSASPQRRGHQGQKQRPRHHALQRGSHDAVLTRGCPTAVPPFSLTRPPVDTHFSCWPALCLHDVRHPVHASLGQTEETVSVKG